MVQSLASYDFGISMKSPLQQVDQRFLLIVEFRADLTALCLNTNTRALFLANISCL